MPTPLQLQDLIEMSQSERFDIMHSAHPLDLDTLADTSYTGVDLSMPPLFHRLFWRSFRKTFHRDPATGRLRGWNVKVEQTGWEQPPEPRRDAQGQALTFGHYEVRSASGLRFPRGWQGAHCLDYRAGGNRWTDFPARNGLCPLVSVNPGDCELLLGWEVFAFGSLRVPINDLWVLRREGPLDPTEIVPRPDQKSVPKQPGSPA
ncbi:MAG: hypothetical protein GXP62_09030 [Oligoflexia bacterium]|nr:hypothetical protein [Oligoflexia bacterium]